MIIVTKRKQITPKADIAPEDTQNATISKVGAKSLSMMVSDVLSDFGIFGESICNNEVRKIKSLTFGYQSV